MQLQCVNPSEFRLNSSQVKIYDGNIDISYQNNKFVLSINGVKMNSVSASWDPSYGSIGGDDSVIACIYR